jgi:hypothetical protein
MRDASVELSNGGWDCIWELVEALFDEQQDVCGTRRNRMGGSSCSVHAAKDASQIILAK